MVDSVGEMAKKHFDEARVFEHYGMICLALDEIVSDGVVEATNWDTILTRHQAKDVRVTLPVSSLLSHPAWCET